MDKQIKLLEWVASEGFKFDGISIWKKRTSGVYHTAKVMYSTKQVIDEYNRSKRKDPTGGQTGLVELG